MLKRQKKPLLMRAIKLDPKDNSAFIVHAVGAIPEYEYDPDYSGKIAREDRLADVTTDPDPEAA